MPDAPADDTLPLTVTLAGDVYNLRIAPGDEAAIRRIGKELNDKLTGFQRTYAGQDKHRYMGMLLLVYALDLYKLKDGREEAPPTSAEAVLPEAALATLRRLGTDIEEALAASEAPVEE